VADQPWCAAPARPKQAAASHGLLRYGVKITGNVQHAQMNEAVLRARLTDQPRFKKYALAILIGLPTWYVIGILISFSKEFGTHLHIQGVVDPGKSIMYAYAAISLGDVLIGLISQWFKSRKMALYLFYAITALGIIWFFNLEQQTATTLYLCCALLGFGVGFWAIFVTMAAEQFGTNIRATVATTVPNMVRGSLVLVSLFFTYLQSSVGYLTSGWITGILVMLIGTISLYFTKETFHKTASSRTHSSTNLRIICQSPDESHVGRIQKLSVNRHCRLLFLRL
jgi:hypothetical protein